MNMKSKAANAALEDAIALIKGLETQYLKELTAYLNKEIQTRYASERSETIAKARNMVVEIQRQYGVSIEDLMKPPRKTGEERKSVGPVEVKYRDPANPENTWTGRGREPKWITNSGKPAEHFKIAA